jgi:2'-5' RNA ligase
VREIAAVLFEIPRVWGFSNTPLGDCCKMRLFIAINFNNDTRARLLALRDYLRGKSERGNFSAPENLHLTLVFLGECDGKQTAAVRSVLSSVSFKPFYAAIERVGRFKRDGGDIWWAGLRAGKLLSALQRGLADSLADCFTLERRGFSPHITLGREVVTDVTPWTIEPFGETVGTIELMKSERINGNLTYTAIDTRSAIL